MKKDNSLQKQKKRISTFLIIFIILLIPTLFIVSDNVKELLNSLSLGSKTVVKKDAPLPSDLKWFNTFGEGNK